MYHQLAKMAGDKAGVKSEGRQLVLVFSQLRGSGDMVELQAEEKPLTLVLNEVQVSRAGKIGGRENIGRGETVGRRLFVPERRKEAHALCALSPH